MPYRLLLGGKLDDLHTMPDGHLHHDDGEHVRGGVRNVCPRILWHVHKQ